VAQYDNPKIVALGAAYKPNTDDQRNSPAQKIVESLLLDGYDIAHYDRHIEGMEYDDLQSVLEAEQPDVVVQLVPHDDTVSELNEIQEKFDGRDIELLQFGESRTPSLSVT
jgi:UDP-N-acetyl-D-mannosaminuronic acid dehydrogenase